MPLVPALCTQCGSKLEIDSSQEAAVCPYCHTPFVTEKAINNYNTTNVTNIGNLHADVVNVSDDQSRDNRVKSGETFIKMNDYASAQKIFSKLTEECPYDHRGWWGLIKVATRNFTKEDVVVQELCDIKRLYERTITVAEEQEKINICNEYNSYISNVESQMNLRKLSYKNQIEQLTAKYNKEKSSIEGVISRLETEKKEKGDPAFVFGLILTLAVIVLSAIIGLPDGFGWFLAGCALFGLPAYGIGFVVCSILTASREKAIKELDKNIMSEKYKLSSCTQKYDCELGDLQIKLQEAGGNI